MTKYKLQIGFAIAVVMLTMFACGFSVSTANIKEAQLAKDPQANQPTTVFAPEDVFYCVVDLANAPDDTTVKAAWTAVQAEGADPNTFIDESELTSGSGNLQFNLTNTNPWPRGTYKVDLYLNGELDRTLEFTVE